VFDDEEEMTRRMLLQDFIRRIDEDDARVTIIWRVGDEDRSAIVYAGYAHPRDNPPWRPLRQMVSHIRAVGEIADRLKLKIPMRNEAGDVWCVCVIDGSIESSEPGLAPGLMRTVLTDTSTEFQR